jgi:hypothetical protein
MSKISWPTVIVTVIIIMFVAPFVMKKVSGSA